VKVNSVLKQLRKHVRGIQPGESVDGDRDHRRSHEAVGGSG